MKTIVNKIKSLKKEATDLRIKARDIDEEIYKLKEDLKKVCPHKKYKIERNSYEEAGRVKYFEWKEKICTKCGKVLATSSEETKTVWSNEI